MSNREDPFKDAETNPEAPKLDMRIIAGLTTGFLWFHRRAIIGILLFSGSIYWIYHSSQAKSEADKAAVSAPRITSTKDESKTDANPPEQVKEEKTEAKNIPNAKIGLANSNPKNRVSTKSELQRMLETGSVEELLEKSLSLREESKKVTPPMAYVIFSERLKISRRLLEMETKETEELYAISSYIESVSILDSLNIEGDLNIVGTEAAIDEVDQKFSNHPDAKIAARANLTVIIRPVYVCLATRDIDMLKIFRNRFDERMEKILADPVSSRRLAAVTLLLIDRLQGDVDETLALGKHILGIFEQNTNPEIKVIAGSFREKLYFGRLGLENILDRIKTDDEETRADVQNFFSAFADNPNCRLELVQLAFSIVQVYYAVDKRDDAKALLKWYQEIVDTMADGTRKSEVIEAVERWKSSVGI